MLKRLLVTTLCLLPAIAIAGEAQFRVHLPSPILFGTPSEPSEPTPSYETVERTVSGTHLNLDVSTLFSETEWSEPHPKIVRVLPTAIVGSSSPSKPALGVIEFGGSLSILNQGSIRGAGGLGSSGAGQPGGDAIDLNGQAVSIINDGTIYAGGGGGGAGGRGGNGVQSSPDPSKWTIWFNEGNYSNTPQRCYYSRSGSSKPYTVQVYWGNSIVISKTQPSNTTAAFSGTKNGYYYECTKPSGGNYSYRAVRRTTLKDTIYNGGQAGNGGRGQGHDGAEANGTAASSSYNGAYGAARGGAGGRGGDWGQNGQAGSSGGNGTHSNGLPGYPGGLAGLAIAGAADLTLSGTGTILGMIE